MINCAISKKKYTHIGKSQTYLVNKKNSFLGRH